MNTEDRSMHFQIEQLQHTFRHACNFGVVGKSNKKTLEKFHLALIAHVASSHTVVLKGYYRNKPVTHFVDRESRLNVMRRPNGEYLSGWKLSVEQLRCLLDNGKLGGGTS
jgi:hypothetical protein